MNPHGVPGGKQECARCGEKRIANSTYCDAHRKAYMRIYRIDQRAKWVAAFDALHKNNPTRTQINECQRPIESI